jgi:hypothetical protein
MFIYSVSKFFNAIQKDFIIDWLEMYGKTCGFYKKTSEFQQKLFQSGIEIEDRVINMLKQKFLPSLEEDVSDGTSQKFQIFQNIPHIFTDLTHLKFQNFTHRDKTLKSIQSIEKPFMIYQGLLCGSNEFGNERPYGIPDLIMRKDILHKLINKEENKEDEKDYVIIDIKKSLKLNKNGTVSKSTNNYKWLEFQLCVYEKFLADELKRPPQSVYVMSLDELENIIIGRIPYVEQDIKTHLEYLKKLKREGDKWVPYPKPTNEYMYPNMKNTYDFVWRDTKLDIARRIGELTLLPYVSMDIRKELWKNGAMTYKDDKCIDVLKSIGNVPEYVREIIRANQNIGLEINAEKVKEELKTLTNNKKLVFVDMETTQKGKVFLSCVYDDVSKKHTHLYCERKDIGDDKVLKDTRELLKQYKENYCIIFYAGQEEKILEIDNGIDLYKILRKHNYAKSGVFSYQLKEIYNNTFRRRIETRISNGLDAMNLYEEDDEKHKKDLFEYVQKDVDIMVKLVSRFFNY